MLFPTYPDEVDQALLTSMIQVLWDRGEAERLRLAHDRDPLPNTPRHTVLLHEAFGDHQVANVATEIEARVIGARLRTPALDPGRSRRPPPFYAIRPVPSYPWSGNALVVFDIGPQRGDLGTPARAGGQRRRRSSAWTRTRSPVSSRLPPCQFSEFLKLDGTVRGHLRRRPPATRRAGPGPRLGSPRRA